MEAETPKPDQRIITQAVAPHSVTLTAKGKGKVQAEVKVYADTVQAAADAALQALADITAKLGDKAASG